MGRFPRIWLVVLAVALLPPLVFAVFYERPLQPVPEPDGALPAASYFGKQALETMPNADGLLYAYEQLAAGVANAREVIRVNGGFHSVTEQELNTVMAVYFNDYPQHFWLGGEYTYTMRDDRVLTVTPAYLFNADALEQAKREFEQAVSKALSDITPGMDAFTREKTLHDFLAQTVAYDDAAPHRYNAYGALVQGAAVCEGYAKAMQYLLYRADIANVLVSGTAKSPDQDEPEDHAWNLVQIDGRYYHLDATWNDQEDTVFYAYFNLPDRLMLEDHTPADTPYDLPACTSMAANYFTIYGGLMDSFSTERLAALLDQNGLTARVFLTGQTDGFFEQVQAHAGELRDRLRIISDMTYHIACVGRETMVRVEGQRLGDVDQDGCVNQDDAQMLREHLDVPENTPLADEAAQKAADANQDGTIDEKDFTLLSDWIAQTAPEP